jgi:hypothetical protein
MSLTDQAPPVMSGPQVYARLRFVTLDAAQNVAAASDTVAPAEPMPDGIAIMAAQSAADVQAAIRLPNPARRFHDIFRTR